MQPVCKQPVTFKKCGCLHTPLLQEVERGDDDICEVDMHNNCVLVNEMKLKVDLTKYAERHQFNFDESLDEYVSNDQVRSPFTPSSWPARDVGHPVQTVLHGPCAPQERSH